jgi:hypothetical protein
MTLKIVRAVKSETWMAGGLIILVSILAYGILIPQLGFYRDDWYMLWAGQAWGTQGIIGLFQGDRPFLGWEYALEYAIFGNSPLGWHIYGLILRIGVSLVFLWFLRLMWPERRIETTFAALLFTLYPGYLQQPNAATFNPTHTAYIAAILSLILNVLAIRLPRWRVIFTILALILVGVYLLIYESLLGIEAFRLIFLWYLVRRDESLIRWRDSIRAILRRAWPYVLLAGGFTFWRLFLFQSVRRSVSIDVIFGQYGQSPLYSIINLLFEFFKDLIEIVILAWFVPFYQFTVDGRLKDLLPALGLAIIIGTATWLYWRWTKNNTEKSDIHQTLTDWLWLGGIFVFVTTLPVIAAGRHVIFGIQWDRYTYQAILGVALLVAGGAFTFLRGRARLAFLFALIFFSVVTHYHSAAFYRDFWHYQRETWQQLAWRAPDLVEGTNIVAILPRNHRLAEEYEVWGPVNLIYSPGGPVKISGQVLNPFLIYDLARGASEERQMRNVPVLRDYSKTLIVYLPGPGACLHVIDGSRPELSSMADDQVRTIAPYSRIEHILSDAAPRVWPETVFGPENRLNWCYYYQKVSLARQRADWVEATRLADEAQSLGLKPVELVEWLPFYESYANTGRKKDAIEISRKIKSDVNLGFSICLMYQAAEWPSGYNAEFIQQTLCAR